MSYLEKLSIKGFKAFTEETSIDFKKLTALAGANSVGKSSVIQAILLGKTAVDNGFPVTYGINKAELAKKIQLNGNFNLTLGKTFQITSSNKINFDFVFKDGRLKLDLEAPVDETYLENTSESILHGMNNFFWDFYYLSAERIGPRILYDEGLTKVI